MCGIIGAALAQIDLEKHVKTKLEQLEYRGYDSAGYTICSTDKSFYSDYSITGIKNLAEPSSSISAHCAIAHTRWATHGAARLENAHPHISHQKLALAHNGVIENHQQLRQKLDQAYPSIRWRSETDSEVIVHWIYQCLQTTTALHQAIKATTNVLQGSYALAIIHSEDPTSIYAVAHQSPLLIGQSEHGFHLASDVVALTETCFRYFRVPEKTIWKLSPTKLSSWPQVKPDWQKTPPPVAASKLNSEKHTLSEIHAQAQLIPKLYQKNPSIVQTLSPIIDQVNGLILLGCGSSHYACQIARYWLEAELKKMVHVELASEFRYRSPHLATPCLLITVSQSGETLDTISAFRYAKKNHPNIHTLTIGNHPHSTLAQASDFFWPTAVGTEVGVATTKVFSSQLLCFAQLAGITQKKSAPSCLSSSIQAALSLEDEIKTLCKQLSSKKIFLLGRGVSYPLAQEGALKIQELAYTRALAFAAGELKHGPLALIDRSSYCFMLLSDDHYLEKNCANICEIQARHGTVIMLGAQQTILKAQKFCPQVQSLSIPCAANSLNDIFSHTCVLQLIAYHLANQQGHSIDKPRNLAKCVTVE